MTQLDEQVGRVLKALKESPHADNTIVVYTADHGLAMGSHGLLGKQNVYEQSMPGPKYRARRRYDQRNGRT